LDGDGEARLIQIACSKPPEGRNRWTLQMIADKLVELEVVESISVKTVERTLKKTNFNPISKHSGSFHQMRTQTSSPQWRMC
jgi:hypothetical protein